MIADTQNHLISLWMKYQDDGTPYVNDFIGFMEWLKERKLKGL